MLSGAQFLSDHDAQHRQIMGQGPPHQPSSHGFVIMAVDVSSGSQFSPRNRRVAGLQVVGPSPGCLSDDFEAADDGVEPERVAAELRIRQLDCKLLSQDNVVLNVAEPAAGAWAIRKHRPHRSRQPVE